MAYAPVRAKGRDGDDDDSTVCFCCCFALVYNDVSSFQTISIQPTASLA